MLRLSREKSREITREKLRASAVNEISVAGFSGASIDRICESAGYSRGAFYANFDSKEDLMLDIMRTHHSREAESWILLLGSTDSIEDLLPVLRDRFAAYLSDNNRILFLTEVQLYAKRNASFWQRYDEEFLSVSIEAERVLEAFYAKVAIKPHRPLPILANMMRGLFAGLVLENGSHAATTERSADLLIVFLEDLMSLGAPV